MKLRVLAAAVRNVHKNFGKIDEGVVRVQLRIEWAGIVPLDRIADINIGRAFRSRGSNRNPMCQVCLSSSRTVPDCEFRHSAQTLEIANAVGEVANLIERVPGGHGDFNSSERAFGISIHLKM